MKSFLILIFSIFSFVARAELNLMSQNETVEMRMLLNEIRSLLPLEVLKIDKTIEIKFSKLDRYEELQNPCDQRRIPQIYGQLKKDTIEINENLRAFIHDNVQGPDEFICGHKRYKKLLLATALHEIIHVYDNQFKTSSSRVYQNLAGSQYQIIGSGKLKNTKMSRSLDPYEYKNVKEHFATNMEFFLLDSDYSCRRPNLARFYRDEFKLEIPLCQNFPPVIIQLQNKMTKLNFSPDNVLDIYFIMAGKGGGAASRFGHAMFRIVLKDRTEDIAVGFVGVTDTMMISNIKGLTGKYPSKLVMNSYSSSLKKYTHQEFRSLTEYKLRLSDLQKEVFISQILTLFYEYSGKYYFITNNCATEALDLIKVAVREEGLLKKNPLTPKGVFKALSDFGVIDINDPKVQMSYWETLEKFHMNAKDVVGNMKLNKYLNLSSSRRQKLLEQSNAKEKLTLIAAFALERAIQSKNFENLEKFTLDYILKLDSKDPANLLSKKIHTESLLLSSAELIPLEYGLPLNNEFTSHTLTLLEERRSLVYSNIIALGEWSNKHLPDNEILEEIRETENNLEIIKSMIRNLK